VGINSAYLQDGNLMLELSSGQVLNLGSVNTTGCTNSTACNFNPSATVDNGSCYYPGFSCDDGNAATQNEVYNNLCQCEVLISGCTQSGACNYNPAANQDDGSCIHIYAPCSDNNPSTINDYIGENCVCMGFSEVSVGAIGQGVTDLNGNVYPTLILGGKEWMAENLRTTQYANGDPIGSNLSPEQWATTYWGACRSANENIAGSNEVYGKLYNTYAIMDDRNVCPAGFKIPTTDDWNSLFASLTSLSELLWVAPNLGPPGVSGFAGLLPQYIYGYYQGPGCQYSCGYTYYPALINGNFTYTFFSGSSVYFNGGAGGANYGIPVRCVRVQ
jgi:hypothetical protein